MENYEVNDSNYWDERYTNNEARWDLKEVSPPIKIYIDSLSNKDWAILIPGCGNAYEAQYLQSRGFTNITLIDFSTVVTDRLKKQFNATNVKVINEDFFQHQGVYDLIIEQTFFCAIAPNRREEYVKHCAELLTQKGKIAGLLFNKKRVNEEPPYVATDQEYLNLFSPYFSIKKMEPCTTSIAPRLGSELWIEFEKK